MVKEWSDGVVSKGEVCANEVMYFEIEKILELNVRPKLADHYENKFVIKF